MIDADKAVSTASYGGGIVSVVSALTLTDWGIIVGIVTALLTFAMNAYYRWNKHHMEKLEHQARMRVLKKQAKLPTAE